jgi:hypothetical protein
MIPFEEGVPNMERLPKKEYQERLKDWLEGF